MCCGYDGFEVVERAGEAASLSEAEDNCFHGEGVRVGLPLSHLLEYLEKQLHVRLVEEAAEEGLSCCTLSLKGRRVRVEELQGVEAERAREQVTQSVEGKDKEKGKPRLAGAADEELPEADQREESEGESEMEGEGEEEDRSVMGELEKKGEARAATRERARAAQVREGEE